MRTSFCAGIYAATGARCGQKRGGSGRKFEIRHRKSEVRLVPLACCSRFAVRSVRVAHRATATFALSIAIPGSTRASRVAFGALAERPSVRWSRARFNLFFRCNLPAMLRVAMQAADLMI